MAGPAHIPALARANWPRTGLPKLGPEPDAENKLPRIYRRGREAVVKPLYFFDETDEATGYLCQEYPTTVEQPDLFEGTFESAEAYVKHVQCVIMEPGNDAIIAAILRMLEAANPCLGPIQNREPGLATWKEVMDRVFLHSIKLKFEHPEATAIRRKLLDTIDAELLYAHPYDKAWGIGMTAVLAESRGIKWMRGANYLGYLLMMVRDYLEDCEPKSGMPRESVEGNQMTRTPADSSTRGRYMVPASIRAGWPRTALPWLETGRVPRAIPKIYQRGPEAEIERIYFCDAIDEETGYLSQDYPMTIIQPDLFTCAFGSAREYVQYVIAILSSSDRDTVAHIINMLEDTFGLHLQIRNREGGRETVKQAVLWVACVSIMLKFCSRGAGAIRRKFLETTDAELVYASPGDSAWGIGMTVDEAQSDETQSRWGRNRLGYCLMMVRDRMAEEESILPIPEDW